ncbi:gamma-glutamyltransferase family protein [Sphaerobacter thermophilus]|uniref:gamma-glutamyltransferase family protein n=1 Tax=Sphaerobacter thermophilus TaxID=2057 RepID=UPI0039C21B4D
MATTPVRRTSHRPPIQARHYVAASGHYLATTAALRILAQGGNAIDAGVAAGICLNVLLPDLTSFGGVAPIMVYHRATDELKVITGLGCWGRSASLEVFLEEEQGEIPVGVRRSVVPGAPDAWLTALARYGKLSFAEVVQPAIELCEGGFPVYPSLHRNIAKEADVISRWPSTAAIFLPGGEVPEVGDVLRQPDLARTFRRMIAAERAAAGRGRVAGIEAARDLFYRGDIGKEIAEFITREGGFVSEEDMAEFHVDVEDPVHTSYRGVDVFACGPWCQGPVIPQTLNVLEGFDLRAMGHNSADYVHTVVSALDLAFSDREAYYGDPKFVDVPLDILLSKEYAARQRERIDPARAFGAMPEPGLGRAGATPEGADARVPLQPDTSYVCVVDEEGNAFSATPSDGIGSTPIVPGLGLLCSGRGSQSWLIPEHASSLQPGKRPRLTPNPAIAFRDGRVWMPFGTPGADMQPQSMIQVLLNVLEFGMDIQEAIEQPRFGTFNYPESFWPHTYRPGALMLEARIPPEVAEELRGRGYDVTMWPEWTRITGNVCAIMIDHDRGTLTGGADARAEAYAAGW